ncbi:MAG TPA: hypothetical protein VE988_13195 [Gemmataceae bacterium]|nr:hypothetical protein [Gemmataceae bacterium]
MAKSRGVDAKLIRLQELRQEAAGPHHLAELRKALADNSSLVVAAAAEIVSVCILPDLTSDLVAAFDRFMVESETTDKNCRAKIAIVDALNTIEHDKEDVFLRALRHVQKEYRWPKMEDTAAALRGDGAFGLVRINYPGVVLLLVDLLTDSEMVARVAAVKALGETRALAAIPLLRYKARVGDAESAVTAECLSALMTAAPNDSIPFVTSFLDWPDEAIQEGAAFALAESRRPDALEVLKAQWPKARHAATGEVILLAIAMTRLPAALDFLLEILAADNQAAALAALSALAIHRHNEAVKERIRAVIATRKDSELQKRFDKKFGGKA